MGIGTDNPSGKLHIQNEEDGVSDAIKIQSSNSAYTHTFNPDVAGYNLDIDTVVNLRLKANIGIEVRGANASWIIGNGAGNTQWDIVPAYNGRNGTGNGTGNTASIYAGSVGRFGFWTGGATLRADVVSFDRTDNENYGVNLLYANDSVTDGTKVEYIGLNLDKDGNIGIGTTSQNARLHIVGETTDGTKDIFNFENLDSTDSLTMNNAGRLELSTGNDIPLLITRPNGNGVLHFRNDANEGSISYFGNGNARYGTGVIQNGSDYEYHIAYAVPFEGSTNTPADLPSMTSKMVLNKDGQLKLNYYTPDNFNATPVKYLGVDSSGNIVKDTPTIDPPNLAEVLAEGSSATGVTTTVNITTTEALILASSGASKSVTIQANTTSGDMYITSFNLQISSAGQTSIFGKTSMPYWTGDSQRPSVATSSDYGVFGFNITRNTIEIYNGTSWVQMS